MIKWIIRILTLGILPALFIITTLMPRQYSELQQFTLTQFDTLVTDTETFILFQSANPFSIHNAAGYAIPAEAAYVDAFNLAAGLSYHLLDTLPGGEWILGHSGTVSVFLFDTDTESMVILYPTLFKAAMVLGVVAFFWFFFLLAFKSQDRDSIRYPIPAIT